MKTKLNGLVPIDYCWAIEEGWKDDALSALSKVELSFDGTLPEPEAAARGGNEPPPPPYKMVDGVAIIAIDGPMTKKPTSMMSLFGGTSTIETRQLLRAAAKDPDVKAVLLLCDTPGGQVAGTSDLADDVAQLAKKKPVIGYASDLTASAGYWVISQCSAVYGNATAVVGSIGVYMVVEDSSAAAADEGIKVHVVRSADFKGAGESGTEVTKKQLAEFERRVVALHDIFVGDVARGRGMDSADIEKLADGRVHVGQAAVEIGLLDGIATLDQVLAAMGAGTFNPRTTDAKDFMASAIKKPAAAGVSATHHSGGKPMTRWEQFKALFEGDDSQGNPDGGNGSPQVIADLTARLADKDREINQLKAQVSGLETSALVSATNGIAAEYVAAKKILPAEKADYAARFMRSAKADAAGASCFDAAGKLIEGELVKDLRGVLDARGAHTLTTEQAPATGTHTLENRDTTPGANDEGPELSVKVSDVLGTAPKGGGA